MRSKRSVALRNGIEKTAEHNAQCGDPWAKALGSFGSRSRENLEPPPGCQGGSSCISSKKAPPPLDRVESRTPEKAGKSTWLEKLHFLITSDWLSSFSPLRKGNPWAPACSPLFYLPAGTHHFPCSHTRGLNALYHEFHGRPVPPRAISFI